jgi:hypothetical protein
VYRRGRAARRELSRASGGNEESCKNMSREAIGPAAGGAATQPPAARAARKPPRSRFVGAVLMYRKAVGRRGLAFVPHLAYEFFLRSPAGQRVCMRLSRGTQAAEYTRALPPGASAQNIVVRISIPKLPPFPLYDFTEHPPDMDGNGSAIVIATTRGGFAISQDLGRIWRPVRPKGYARHEFLHVKSLGRGEYLAQAVIPEWKHGARQVDTLVLDAAGEVRAANRIAGSPWHGCRAVDISGETLMFAEYPYEPQERAQQPCRVFRSRDRGRSWQIAFERPPNAIRHFHFLQARRGHAGEWWLSSGDEADESRLWVSRDDGDSWTDISSTFGSHVAVDGIRYPRSLFRLTDLVWLGEEAIWGTDHYMPGLGGTPRGGKVVRTQTEPPLTPHLVGTTRWPIRNIIDVGEFWILLTQGPFDLGAARDERRPGVYLMPKRPAPDGRTLFHLFDVEAYSPVPTGFTYSKASRKARGGVFFNGRSGTDVFPFGHKLLKWEVILS